MHQIVIDFLAQLFSDFPYSQVPTSLICFNYHLTSTVKGDLCVISAFTLAEAVPAC